MPICSRCGVMQATVEMRRSPKKTRSGEALWLCKGRTLCMRRVKEARIHEKARARASQN